MSITGYLFRGTENLNSKHRKRVPVSVNPRPDTAAPDGDFSLLG